MRTAALIPAIALAAAAAAPAWAQHHGRTWPKEPAAVFGLELGKPIAADDIPECSSTNRPPAARFHFCRRGVDGLSRILVGGFNTSSFGEGIITVKDGRAVALTIFSLQRFYPDLRDVMVERYGPPSVQAIDKPMTRAGVEYRSERMEWWGSKVHIRQEERAATINDSVTIFEYIPALREQATDRAKRAKSEASKM